ncbi:LysR substrate-binding domain-containing protein [Phyllobacterium sp. 22229]|uniref:LysR substrate-binding domain-containing protein n=1 Tax=Phyllobacterium TaxID=28100 RepID=UPI001028FAEE|nr:LysR substrate-binding domain-containing protein [Phyllobacterium myrsinacearum]RZS77815.1 LysR family transcriptional regulator [Phyllobacterium myrsinacearum]
MVRYLPPLSALKAFEAAARHLSFARAGGELGVTPGAISHHMKQLEEWVGGALFERRANGVVLTERGRVYSKKLGAIFDQITSATVSARSSEMISEVIIRCQFSLAARWLAPRMATFHTAHPDISINISALPHRWNAQDPSPDLAIYHSHGDVVGMQQDLLLTGHLAVVCAPGFLDTLPPHPTPADLLNQPLIKINFSEPGWYDDGWESWFIATGFGHLDLHFSISFNLIFLAIEACIAGAGFALIPNFLIERELLNGTLVDPFGIQLPVRQPYVLMTPEPSLRKPEVAIVRSWLLAQ